MAESKLVGPVIRGFAPEIVDAVIDAIEMDNPDSEITVDDAGGYVRIGVAMKCRLTRASLEEALGRPFTLPELELSLSAFAGRMRVDDETMEWYLERED